MDATQARGQAVDQVPQPRWPRDVPHPTVPTAHSAGACRELTLEYRVARAACIVLVLGRLCAARPQAPWFSWCCRPCASDCASRRRLLRVQRAADSAPQALF